MRHGKAACRKAVAQTQREPIVPTGRNAGMVLSRVTSLTPNAGLMATHSALGFLPVRILRAAAETFWPEGLSYSASCEHYGIAERQKMLDVV